MVIEKYIIIEFWDSDAMKRNVEYWLEKGWELRGQLQIIQCPGGNRKFFQVMVKYAPTAQPRRKWEMCSELADDVQIGRINYRDLMVGGNCPDCAPTKGLYCPVHWKEVQKLMKGREIEWNEE